MPARRTALNTKVKRLVRLAMPVVSVFTREKPGCLRRRGRSCHQQPGSCRPTANVAKLRSEAKKCAQSCWRSTVAWTHPGRRLTGEIALPRYTGTTSGDKAAEWYRQYLKDSELDSACRKRRMSGMFIICLLPNTSDVINSLTYLKEQQIFCGIHYPLPLHHAEPYATVRSIPRNLPVCSELADKIFSLPMFPGITEEQIIRVSDAVKSFSATFDR